MASGEFIGLLVLAVIGLLIGVPLWLITKVNELFDLYKSQAQQLDAVGARVGRLEQFRDGLRTQTAPVAKVEPSERPAPVVPVPVMAPPVTPTPVAPARPVLTPMTPVASRPPLIPALPPIEIARPIVVPPKPPTSTPAQSSFDLEQFLGVKLFAWLGGLVLFLAVAFFIKYSVEHNYITPWMRVAGGFALGTGLIVGALRAPRERYRVTVEALCAVGVLVLYADFFAAYNYYHLIPSMTATFALMALVTVTAFLLAVQLDAQVVAVLGLLGGFLTPVLLSTGVDNPPGLFGYLALLDMGLMAVALRKRWPHLVGLGAVATALMQLGWVARFFITEKHLTAMTIFFGFAVLFVAACIYSLKRRQKPDQAEPWMLLGALLMPMAGLAFAGLLIMGPFGSVASQPGLLFGFVFVLDALLLVVASMRLQLRAVQLLAGGVTFVLLAIWTSHFVTKENLLPALGLYLVFAVLHAVYPLVLQRLVPGHTPAWWSQLFPSLALVLVLIPMFQLPVPSILLWVAILAIDAMALLLAALTASLAAVAAVLALTTLATVTWIFRVPVAAEGWLGLPGMLFLIAGAALLFFFGSLLVEKLLIPGAEEESRESDQPATAAWNHEFAQQLSATSAVMPFMLLILVITRLPLANPSPVFGLATLLCVLLLGLVRQFKLGVLALVGLAGTLIVECVWHQPHMGLHQPMGWLPAGWYLFFSLLFLLAPFVFYRRLGTAWMPWVASALALPAHFALIHSVCKINLAGFGAMGLIPAACAVPTGLGLLWILRCVPKTDAGRNTLVALFGGATLFFTTLIFPIQYEKNWLTVGWALEGAALLWLYLRVPYEGLRWVGIGLLATAFGRLALNPEVFGYYPRSETRIWNWYLYTYGIVAACQFVGATLLRRRPLDKDQENLPALYYALGTVLAFLLVNIEIADFFSTGTTLAFRFTGSLAQDMTYSIAWALFALILLVVGFGWRVTGARRAGLGLMVVTLLKLFLHDLWNLGGLYRIGSLVGLAVVLILASTFYQRFLAVEKTEDDAPVKPQ